MHPRFAHIAMEIARILGGTLISANVTAYLLRDNFDIQFWHKVLALMRGVVLKNISEKRDCLFDLLVVLPNFDKNICKNMQV